MIMEKGSTCQAAAEQKLPAQLAGMEDEDDPEVMQVVDLLRAKKERAGINGTLVPGDEELTRERPMSWEGELSDDELMPPHHHHLHPHLLAPVAPLHHNSNGVYQEPPRPPASPMCVVDNKEDVLIHSLGRRRNCATETKTCIIEKDSNDSNSTMKAECSNGGSITSSPIAPINCSQAPFIPTNSPVSARHTIPPFGGSRLAVFSNDRLTVGHSVPYDNALAGHCSPAQTRHPVGFAGPYSQSPSPVLTCPTSSSSSRSSYSPTQSPLMGRHINSASSAYSHTQSPVLSRHAGTSSDGSVYSPSNSPLQGRHVAAENSVYSPTQSPSQGRHVMPDGLAGFSPSQSPAHLRNMSLARPLPFGACPSPPQVHHSPGVTPDQSQVPATENHPPSYHYNLQEHSSVDGRIPQVSPLPLHPTQDTRSTTSSASVASSASDESNASDFSSPTRRLSSDNSCEDNRIPLLPDLAQGALALSGSPGISRQQLLSGPCPICGDRISGFHYGIFSCESCKGFFKRTVQNKKNYVCLRGANCHVAVNTRKKCPACRFDKCLKMGMKLEAIREDRTRGGRSTYQCSYTLPSQSLNDGRVVNSADGIPSLGMHDSIRPSPDHQLPRPASEPSMSLSSEQGQPVIPPLIQEILSVEHLWHCTDKEIGKLSEQFSDRVTEGDPDFLSILCNIADHRLYKIVKWCKSLPLFREIQIDDQIALLINSWCELLLLSCCHRSISTPSEIRVSVGKSITLRQARIIGMGPLIERLLNLTEHLRRLQMDQYEYVCLKVIILLTSDASGLKEPEKVRCCQKQVLEALQTYTRSHYPQQQSKFGELLLRIPELERACQVGKDSLATKQRVGEVPSFNLLMELLRGDH